MDPIVEPFSSTRIIECCMSKDYLKLVETGLSRLAPRRLSYDLPHNILSEAFQSGDLTIDPLVTVRALRDTHTGEFLGRMGIEYRAALYSPFNPIGRIVTNDYQYWGHQHTSMEIFPPQGDIQRASIFTSPYHNSSEGDNCAMLSVYHDQILTLVNAYFPVR